MEHIAIDLGGRESQICVMSEEGEAVLEERRATRGLGAFLAKRPAGRVVLESCAEAFTVADAARRAGHEVVVVPATLVRALGVGARGLKTDVRDARNLAEASCRMKRLPAVHAPATASNSGPGTDAPGSAGELSSPAARARQGTRGVAPGAVEQVLAVIEKTNSEIAASDEAVEEIAMIGDFDGDGLPDVGLDRTVLFNRTPPACFRGTGR